MRSSLDRPLSEVELSEVELVERIARLEQQKNALAAQQCEAILAFARAHVTARIASGTVEPAALERSVIAQVGLACRASPTEARARLRMARDLHAGLDHVRGLFATGALDEYRTRVVAAATAHLEPAQRAVVDQHLAGQRLETLGARRLGDLARTLTAQVAPEAFLGRARAARSGRRVTVRPAADGMADLTAHLPAEQAVACYAALAAAVRAEAVRPEPVTRGRGQIMADTLVERLTGQTTAPEVNLEIQVMVPVQALLDPASPLPAQLPGHGPIPMEVLTTRAGRTTWRRLLSRDGIVIGGDSRRRAFTGPLASLIRARDGGRCREPYCDAPIRHLDHIRRWADGGPTSLDNGRGLCEFHNHVRETAGWTVEKTGDMITTITPTGHAYRSEMVGVAEIGSPARASARCRLVRWPGASPARPAAAGRRDARPGCAADRRPVGPESGCSAPSCPTVTNRSRAAADP